MTSVIYKPENIVVEQGQEGRGVILKKHCAASSLNDKQEQIKRLTLLAAKKEGITKDTELVAISDGAVNCWNVIDHLQD